VLEKAAAFYQLQLHRHPEAVQYLAQTWTARSSPDRRVGHRICSPAETCGVISPPKVIRWISLLDTGLINHQGRDAFCQRVIFPCRQHGHIVNL